MDTKMLQTLDRGVQTLKMIANSPGGGVIADMATELGVHRAVVYRIIATLEAHDLVHRLKNGRIFLGSGLMALAAKFSPHLRGHAKPLIEELAEQTRATAFLTMAMGEKCVAVLTAEPTNSFLNIAYREGKQHPIHLGAAGIAILAARPPKPDDLEKILAARRDGYSATAGELQAGAVGVASPVRLAPALHPGLECSIGVVAMNQLDIPEAANAVMQATKTLANQLGAEGNYGADAPS